MRLTKLPPIRLESCHRLRRGSFVCNSPIFLPRNINMASIPNKITDRLVAGIKRFQPILSAAKARDAGEADTVTIVINMLGDIFGYDKYSEVTSEHLIKSTYCDLAIKV